MTVPAFQRMILAWHKDNRRDMPWRATSDPYRILVSEVMLQQTQVSRVEEKYREFLRAFPSLDDLARAQDKRLLSVWKGLGYWKRARHLKEAAAALSQTGFARDPKELQTLPGVGPYTARAVACFAFQNGEAFLDTNIRRVYLHFFFAGRQSVSDKEILPLAQKAVWRKNPREWHYALFDYGALVLKDKSVNRRSRHYAKQSRFEGSFRSFRTKVIQELLARPQNTADKNSIAALLKDSPYSAKEVLASLKKDGLLKETPSSFTL